MAEDFGQPIQLAPVSDAKNPAAPDADGSVSERAESTNDLPEQLRIRREKRERILADGRDAYPVEVARTHTLAQIRDEYGHLTAGAETGVDAGIAGRIIFLRNKGKLCFATLQEGNGTQLQVMVSFNGVGEESLARWKADVDLGDIVFVHGQII
ncbi:lysyl-tRNA synthetase, partial [Gordonia araii NBRC 100433]